MYLHIQSRKRKIQSFFLKEVNKEAKFFRKRRHPDKNHRCSFTVAVVNIVIMRTDVNTESEIASFFTSNEKTRDTDDWKLTWRSPNICPGSSTSYFDR